MKYILLLMMVSNLKIYRNNLKDLFKTKKKRRAESEKARVKMMDAMGTISGDKDADKGLVSAGIIIVSIYNLIMSSMMFVYVGDIVFALMGCLLMIRQIKSMNGALKSVRGEALVENFNSKKIGILANLSYHAYFIYFLAATWNM